MPKFPYKVSPKLFRTSEAERICGVAATDIRNWRKRGYLESPDGHAWHTPADLARLLLVEKCRAGGLSPADTYTFVDDAQVIGSIVVHAANYAGRIIDATRDKVLKKNPALQTKASFVLAGDKAVSGSPLLVWSPDHRPQMMNSLDDVDFESSAFYGSVVHALNLRHLSKLLADRTIHLATLEDA